jgi:hypothetical protein
MKSEGMSSKPSSLQDARRSNSDKPKNVNIPKLLAVTVRLTYSSVIEVGSAVKKLECEEVDKMEGCELGIACIWLVGALVGSNVVF